MKTLVTIEQDLDALTGIMEAAILREVRPMGSVCMLWQLAKHMARHATTIEISDRYGPSSAVRSRLVRAGLPALTPMGMAMRGAYGAGMLENGYLFVAVAEAMGVDSQPLARFYRRSLGITGPATYDHAPFLTQVCGFVETYVIPYRTLWQTTSPYATRYVRHKTGRLVTV